MSLAIDVVKRSGHRRRNKIEAFDADKLLRSLRAACLSVRTPEGEADMAARSTANAVIIWCQTKPMVTSHDLRRIASVHLKRYHPEAAYFYQHHRNII